MEKLHQKTPHRKKEEKGQKKERRKLQQEKRRGDEMVFLTTQLLFSFSPHSSARNSCFRTLKCSTSSACLYMALTLMQRPRFRWNVNVVHALRYYHCPVLFFSLFFLCFFFVFVFFLFLFLFLFLFFFFIVDKDVSFTIAQRNGDLV